MAEKERTVHRRGGPLDGESFTYVGDLIKKPYSQPTPFGNGVYEWRGDTTKNGERILIWVENGIEGG